MSETTLATKAEAVNSIATRDGELQLTNSAEMMRFASQVIASGLAPSSFKTPASVLVAMQMGAELGLKPMASLQHIAVINGRPSIYGKAVAAVVMRSGKCEDWREFIEGEGDKMTAVCRARRKGLPEWKEARFSVADAKQAGLLNKSGPWTQYLRDMLGHKARARCFGTLFADVLCGLPVMEDVREAYEAKPAALEDRTPSAPDPLLKDVTGTVVADAPAPEPVLDDPEGDDADVIDTLKQDQLNALDDYLKSNNPAELRAAVFDVAGWHEGADAELVERLVGGGSVKECKAFLTAAKERVKA